MVDTIAKSHAAVEVAWEALDAAQAHFDEISAQLSSAPFHLRAAEKLHMEAVYRLRALEAQSIPQER